MLTTIEATYENGQIIWHETPPLEKKGRVLVTFLEGERGNRQPVLTGGAVRFGSLKGLIEIGDDFNDPLDDLKDYMY